MSRIKLLFSTLILAIFGGIFLTSSSRESPPVEPIPMPLYKGTMPFTVGVLTAFPQPNRDESVKKWLIPSVRIRVPGASGSGTICYYDRSNNVAYVISCAHLFKKGDSKATIEVFYKNDKKLASPARFEAKVISYKVGYYGDDISIMSFKPDWIPHTWFPIASIDHTIVYNQLYYSCGCDNASEVACYFVKPQGIDGAFLATRENSPRPGRSGGGLMDSNGYFVGICVRTSDVSGNGTGFFVHLKTIHDYCKNNKLDFLLKVNRPNELLNIIPIIDRNGLQGEYPPGYVPVP